MEFYQFDPRVEEAARRAQQKAAPAFGRIEEIEAHNTAKVLRAFSDQRVSESHFAGSTG